MPIGLRIAERITGRIAERLETKAARWAERAKAMREKATKIDTSAMERSPKDGDVVIKQHSDAPVAEKKGFWSRLFSKKPAKTAEPTAVENPLAEAKKLDSTLAEKLEKAKYDVDNPYHTSTVSAYTPERILEIVKTSKKDPELAMRLAKELNGEILYARRADALFDMSKNEPEVFNVVKRFLGKVQREEVEALQNLKHVSPEKVKFFSKESVLMIEKAASKDAKAVNEVLDSPLFNKLMNNPRNSKNMVAEDSVGKFVELASENPKKAESCLTTLDNSLKAKNVANGIEKMSVHNVNEILTLHKSNPELVESIISKYGFSNAEDIKTLVEYGEKGIKVDKYVNEYLSSGENSGDLKKYIDFRLKTGSLYDKMLVGKTDAEVAEFQKAQFAKTKDKKNITTLDRIVRDGRTPENEEELDKLIEVYNRYPDRKITDGYIKFRNAHKDMEDTFDLGQMYDNIKR